MSQPRWYEIAMGEMGVQEIPGPRHEDRILQYHGTTSLGAKDDETAWCASFAGWCLMQAGLAGTGSAAARSYLDWGRPIDKPTPGCVVVFWRGSKAGRAGHVGFYAGKAADGRILVLGGNQGNRVSVAPYSASQLLGYRWPSGVALPPDVQPKQESKVVQGTVASTAAGSALTVGSAVELAGQLQQADQHIQAGTIIGIIAGAVIVAASVYALVSRIRAARS